MKKVKELQKIDDNGKSWKILIFLLDEFSSEPQLLDKSLKQYKWFNFSDVPYLEMHKGNVDWLPEIFSATSDVSG